MVVEREAEAGGIPLYLLACHVRADGFLSADDRSGAMPTAAPRPCPGIADTDEHHRHRHRQRSSGDTVLDAREAGTISPRRILLATGIRETPRAARLISGDRPQNVLTTGALQRLVEAGAALPFRAPIIVGSELVSFSAVLTLRHAGVQPVAMIEAGARIVARKPADFLTRHALGTPVMTGCRLMRINASPFDASKLESVTIEDARRRQQQALLRRRDLHR